ncbi:MAG TPA: hypothetical protein VMS56_01275 [Thermoanaerobaculia bacterium]|nr:hypothetical protein [Thermoanaerobaculia bacterium]
MSFNRMMRFTAVTAVLVLAVACSTTTSDDVTRADVMQPATAETHDPIGQPPRVVSDIGATHPSSVTGGTGNVNAGGTNTNLNQPPPADGTATVTTSEVVVTEAPALIEPAPVVVEERTVIERRTVIDEPAPVVTTVETRTLMQKD